MANIIAIVWDFDRTLVDGYMHFLKSIRKNKK